MSDEYGASESALMRHQSYRDSLKLAMWVMLISVVVACASVTVVLIQYMKPEKRYFFATQRNGEILPLVALDDPHLSHAQIQNFAAMCATKALSLRFDQIKNGLADAQECFNRDGWDGFTRALDDSGVLKFITERRVNSSATISAPVIVEEGLDANKRFTWRLEVPISIAYESSSEKSAQSISVMLEVVRTEVYDNVTGVAISKFIGRPK